MQLRISVYKMITNNCRIIFHWKFPFNVNYCRKPFIDTTNKLENKTESDTTEQKQKPDTGTSFPIDVKTSHHLYRHLYKCIQSYLFHRIRNQWFYLRQKFLAKNVGSPLTFDLNDSSSW